MYSSVVQGQKTTLISANIISKQILPFGFAEQHYGSNSPTRAVSFRSTSTVLLIFRQTHLDDILCEAVVGAVKDKSIRINKQHKKPRIKIVV